ncbi:MAG: phosphate ABC transporter permease subunit PstC [Acidobacteria bacterium]|nr:phosphate ABC transporter permease subunit PstC [Acidobacteriota bacterium]MBI3655011.1 phosphate ABC transporter permease subunit PstC [Acidobacteriota bacterium]
MRAGVFSNIGDRIFRGVTLVFGAMIMTLVILMVAEMTRNSTLSFRQFGLGFLSHSEWDPVHERFGAWPFIYGTVVSSLLSLILAVPLSLGTAIFLAELARGKLSVAVAFLVELLAAIPSVTYGLWGIFVLAPFLRQYAEPALAAAFGFLPMFRGTPHGIDMLAGGLILAIMVTPIISAVTRDVLMAVPRTQREAALALGATRWEATKVALSYAKSGILGAVILGLGRALGETMAVTMVIGNRPQVSGSLFDPSYTMASVISNEFTEATSDLYRSALIEIGLLLFLVTIVVQSVARLLVWRVGRRLKEAKA